ARPAAFFERFVERGESACQSGNDSEDQAGQERERAGKAEHDAVDADLFSSRQIVRETAGQRVYAPGRQQQPYRAAGHGQQQAFGQQLPHDPPASRAERRADGDLLLSRFGSRQQQVGHVGASDQQEEADRDQQRQQSRTRILRQ